jgi:hypothetical protein
VSDCADRAQIEADENCSILQSKPLHGGDSCARQFVIRFFRTPTLQFNVDDKSFGCLIDQQPEDIVESGNGLSRVFGTREVRVLLVESTSKVSLAKVRRATKFFLSRLRGRVAS